MRAVGTVFLLAAALGFGSLGSPQSLADAAKKERERRAKQEKEPARTYGDADLDARKGDAAPGNGSPSPSPSASAKPAASPSPSGYKMPSIDDEAAERKKQEAEWRVRFANARERVAAAEANGWYDTVETVFVNGIPVQQRVRKFQETDELRQARKALADLEEEFRRTGLPPGWTRN
jgi:hypothetical protein